MRTGRADIEACVTGTARGTVVDLSVHPKARRDGIEGVHAGRLRVKVTAPPESGRANDAVVDLVAEALGAKRARLEITSGASSRRKRILVVGMAPSEVLERLAAHLEG